MAIPLYLLLIQANTVVYALLVVFATCLGVWICQKASDRLGVHESWRNRPGMKWLASGSPCFAVPPGLLTISLGFVLFSCI